MPPSMLQALAYVGSRPPEHISNFSMCQESLVIILICSAMLLLLAATAVCTFSPVSSLCFAQFGCRKAARDHREVALAKITGDSTILYLSQAGPRERRLYSGRDRTHQRCIAHRTINPHPNPSTINEDKTGIGNSSTRISISTSTSSSRITTSTRKRRRRDPGDTAAQGHGSAISTSCEALLLYEVCIIMRIGVRNTRLLLEHDRRGCFFSDDQHIRGPIQQPGGGKRSASSWDPHTSVAFSKEGSCAVPFETDPLLVSLFPGSSSRNRAMRPPRFVRAASIRILAQV